MAEGSEPLDRRARQKARRRERLLALLPRIYAVQPEGSAVGTLLDALASRLADVDEATERILRDRWVALAGGEPSWDDGMHPLERLGALLGVTREAWEEAERYRRRLRQSAPVLVQGTATVRNVMTLAAAALDTELCPRLQRLPEDPGATPDTTLGLGVRPGTRAGCPGCKDPKAACAARKTHKAGQQGATTARLLLTDNPLDARALLLKGLEHDGGFRVRNSSLAADRPVVTLKALTPVRYPVLRNLDTRGTTLFAGSLATGETLVLRPLRLPEDVAPFQGYSPEGPALQYLADPAGHAFIQRTNGTLEDVSRLVFFMQGSALFADEQGVTGARFVGSKDETGTGARFALLAASVLTPRVEPGENDWVYGGFTRRDVEGMADADLVRSLRDNAPESPEAGKVDLTLEWWTRPPASVRLRIPTMPPVDPPTREKVMELVRRSLDRARAAGVRATVDFPEPPRHEDHPQTEAAWAAHLRARAGEAQGMAEAAWRMRTGATHAEQQPLGEVFLRMQGVFDMTRLDWSYLAPDSEEKE